MNNHINKDRVERLFDKIKILTAMLIEDFSITEFYDVMHERSETVSLLKIEIEKERERLLKDTTLFSFNRRINQYLAEVKDMDAKVITLIKNRMNEIQSELASLSKKGSAALAYASHKR